MEKSVFIEVTYSTVSRVKITLPEGKKWSDVANFYVKWDRAYFQFQDGTQFDEALMTEPSSIGMKWPDTLKVLNADSFKELKY